MAMGPLACLMHWYISMMYVVPVLAVGGWGWWSSKKIARKKAAGGSKRELAKAESRDHGGASKVRPAVHFDIS
jgi:hypothetical protein